MATTSNFLIGKEHKTAPIDFQNPVGKKFHWSLLSKGLDTSYLIEQSDERYGLRSDDGVLKKGSNASYGGYDCRNN